MQIKKNQKHALKQFPTSYKVMMLFGPNQKLVEHYANDAKAHAASLGYQIAFTSYDEIKKNITSFIEQISIEDLFCSKKIIILDLEKANVTQAFIDVLSAGNHHVAILIRAADLPAGHSLRRAFETSETMASIGCYDIEQNYLRDLITEELRSRKINATHDIIRMLGQNYHDPGLLKQDIEILDMWLGARRDLVIADILMLRPELGNYEYLDLAYSLVFNQKNSVLKIFREMLYQGVSNISILRAMMNFFYRLYNYHVLVEDFGPDIALSKLYPQVFFKEKPDFLKAAALTSAAHIIEVLEGLINIENTLKETDIAANAVIEHFFLHLNENQEIFNALKTFSRC